MKKSAFHFFYALLVFFLLVLQACNTVTHYVNKAGRKTEDGNLVEARRWYQKALDKDPESYKANLGLGITLAEFMDRYEEGLPYLQKALEKSPKDTFVDLLFALGKCHQHIGEYEKALTFYNRLNNVVAVADDNTAFQMELKKRKEDCQYGLTHTDYTPLTNWYVVNLGKGINTDMPEYVPVITPDNALLFTSKRKDSKKETINYWDGKYFESMYISDQEPNGYYKNVRRYTLPDLFARSRFRKGHESVISMSPDGKTLFVYRDTRIYEINMTERGSKEPRKMGKTVNFDYYQNHACLSSDGQTLFFTSESEGGIGGNDIYMAHREAEGIWSKPVNLGAPVNTTYDEDAPFITPDGKTLYFASKGQPGYGNFDIYKSTFENGTWSQPENLGRPINSPAHDIFMVQNLKGNIGYFSSSRTGGQGDMDIYKVNYINDFNLPCTPGNETAVALSVTLTDSLKALYAFDASLAVGYTPLHYQWQQNGSSLLNDARNYTTTLSAPGEYAIALKIVAACDTCLQPYVGCKQTVIRPQVKTIYDSLSTRSDIESMSGVLNETQLKALGFDTRPVLFDFNKSEIREDAMQILDANIAVLKKYPALVYELDGYADQRGTERYNRQLSITRAQAVRSYLSARGINEKRMISANGYGNTHFVYDCATQQCDDAMHQANRRVTFTVTKVKP